MPVQPGVWGIDLGQCGLKAIRLQEIEGQVVATAFDYVEHPKILSQPDADPDQLTREALDKFLSRNNLRGDIVAISVPGQSGLARFVKLPPVEEKKIADIVRFEAKQQIPFNLDEVVWDYQKIGSGAVTDGFAMETEIGLFAMKRDMVSRYLQHFKDVGVDVHLVQMAPLALCNYVAFDLLGKDAAGGEPSGDKKCIVALDIGADSSNLVITDGERIIWQRPIPLGGNHFTRALTKDLKLTFAKAEHLKRNATKSPDLKKILASLKPVLNDFVGEVQRSLGYFTNTHRDAHIDYMIGLGNAFRLPGLQKFLSEKLQLEVRKLGKIERIVGDQVVTQQVYTENVLTFAVAYGLALQGLKRARLLTNLLPHEIRVERLVKAKKPFAVAAAAALLLACGGLALSYHLELRTYADPSVKAAEAAADKAKKAADSAAARFKKSKDDAAKEEQAVRTIVAGQFERDNWPELLKFISTAVPQMDGSVRRLPIANDGASTVQYLTIPNLPDKAVQMYWEHGASGGIPGKKAYDEYIKRLIAGKDEANTSDDLPPGAEDLIQFNIETVSAFYCDNLATYWSEVRNSSKVKPMGKDGKDLVRPQAHFSKAPDGSGWIVSVQGWTYHRDQQKFVWNTILDNIANLGIPQSEEDKKAAAPGNPPPPPGGKVPPPAPGQANAATEPKDDLGPVVNHISHVVLYDWILSDPKGTFELIGGHGNDELRNLALAKTVAAGGGGSGAPPMMGMMGGAGKPGMEMGGGGGGGDDKSKQPTGPGRDSWSPLSALDAGTRSGGTGRSGGAGGPKGGLGGGKPPLMGPGGGTGADKMKQQMGNKGGMLGPMGPMGGKNVVAESDSGSGPRRTEFVILFIWKEPTPSDAYRGLSSGAQGSTPGGQPAGVIKAPRPRHERGIHKDEKKDEPKQNKEKSGLPKDDKKDEPKQNKEKKQGK